MSVWEETVPDREFQAEGVGLEQLLDQKVRLGQRKGWQFNLLIAGDSGLGKTTFINSLFLSPLRNVKSTTIRDRKKCRLETGEHLIKEGGVSITLNVIDTPGFGDQYDSQSRNEGLQDILAYVDEQLDRTLRIEESKENRTRHKDTRVHLCLYFLSPGAALNELDKVAMTMLCEKVNLIPVIAKGDTLTPEEKDLFKLKVLEQLEAYSIPIYPFNNPEQEFDDHAALIPFAVMGSNTFIDDEQKIRGRIYDWGTISCEDENVSDLVALRNFLVSSNLLDLVDSTEVHYEKFRGQTLVKEGKKETKLKCDADYEQFLIEERDKMLNEKKMIEQNMRQNFIREVQAKEKSLEAIKEELDRKQEALITELDRMRDELERDTIEFEQMKDEVEYAERQARMAKN
eukprot:Lithocolla_globosa_v1_NODE_1325_length_2669_cov_32.932288.p1 type:complete len:400 gc:universal NODE_1325_length_2669_cov_32.932288:520-1719(+)